MNREIQAGDDRSRTLARRVDRLRAGAKIALSAGALLWTVVRAPPVRAEGRSQDEFQQMADALGKTLYFFAFPTATYTGIGFKGVSSAPGGLNVTFKLDGRSGFDDSYLYTEAILTIRDDGQITNLRWGRNNALLARPGSTMKALGAALQDLNNDLAQAQQAAAGFVFTNECEHPVELAINYQRTDGRWETAGWWQVAPGRRISLNGPAGRLTTRNPVWYYFARTTDDSDLAWRGDHQFVLQGDVYGMRELVDREGDSEWSTVCND